MDDKIHQLSAHIANQIAAGEVIQRPASVVKELLENALDAEASHIHLIIRDAGKEEVQVIDNGVGMSENDALKAFDRHATSKIRTVEDLFSLRTMGFRGEALASMASVGKVELKTRMAHQELGTRLVIEGSQVLIKEPVAMDPGTSISLKHLFFNIPARKHFLKSNSTEWRHILEEFTRIALAHPQIHFQVHHEGRELYDLKPASLKSRMIQLLGQNLEKNLVPVEEPTEIIGIRGFIGKPESATKSRTNQFFFINGRYIRSSYLHHAVTRAYEGLMEKESSPPYVLFFDIDPARIDANVHPTKQEVKFEDEKLVYAYLNAAVRHSLAKYNIAPSLDFTLDQGIQQLSAIQKPATEDQKSQTRQGYLYSAFRQKDQAHFIDQKNSLKNWKSLYSLAKEQAPLADEASPSPTDQPQAPTDSGIFAGEKEEAAVHSILRVHQQALITTVKSGIMIIHIQRAKERIWYERLLARLENAEQSPSQKTLFPMVFEVSAADAPLLKEMLEDLGELGFELHPIGPHSYAIQATPSGMVPGTEIASLEDLLAGVRDEIPQPGEQRKLALISRLAKRWARQSESDGGASWAQELIDELFACTQPQSNLDGKRTFRLISLSELEEWMDARG